MLTVSVGIVSKQARLFQARQLPASRTGHPALPELRTALTDAEKLRASYHLPSA